MTLERKSGAGKTRQAQNAGTSQPAPLKAGDNLFDRLFSIVPAVDGYWLLFPAKTDRMGKSFDSLDDLMTFLADQAIEKMGRREQ